MFFHFFIMYACGRALKCMSEDTFAGVISFPTEISALFPRLIEDINILVVMNQLFGGKESDERSSPDLVQQRPTILQMNLNEQKQNHANPWCNFL